MFYKHHDPIAPVAAAANASLAEILGAFSYALDLTEGQPAGHSVRSCWIATRLGAAIGLADNQLWDVFYAVLLKDLGCSSNAARVAELFVGDDRALKASFKLIGPAPEDFGAFIMGKVGIDATEQTRDAAIANLAANGAAIMTGIMDTRCTRGADIARRLRFGEGVASAIAHLDEHWDGAGLPCGASGTAIPIGARIALLAQIVDVFHSAKGTEAARREVAARSGGWLDPELCAAFLTLSADPRFWDDLSSPDIEASLFALEPAQHRIHVDEDYLDDIATAFGQVIDAKSAYTGGHSERVGLFADKVAERLGMAPADRRRLRRAAMLHDVGKLGVSSAVLEKPGSLDADEWIVMKGHAAETANILSRVCVMRDMAMIAGAHHERLDGGGYPLGLDATMIALETRIITVADFFDALTADRPYRTALSVEQALEIMADEVGSAIDAGCFAALRSVVAAGIPTAPLPSINISISI